MRILLEIQRNSKKRKEKLKNLGEKLGIRFKSLKAQN
jgi:hypothetical protein